MLLSLSVMMSGCQSPPDWRYPAPLKSCMQLIPAVARYSRFSAAESPANWVIVDIYDVKPNRPGLAYQCRGIAKLSDGKFAPLQFGIFDLHGTQASVYSFEPN